MANTDSRTNAVASTQAVPGNQYFKTIEAGDRRILNLVESEVEPMMYAQDWKPANTVRRITSPLADIVDMRILAPGNIVNIWIFADGGTGVATFNVRKNGAALFSGGDRPTLTGSGTASKTGQSIPVIFGDRISLELVLITGSGLKTDLTFAFEVEPDDA